MARVIPAPAHTAPRPGTVDAALALLFAAGAMIEVWASGVHAPVTAKLVLAVLTTVPLAWRTVAPLPVVVLTSAAYASAVLLGVPADEPLVPLMAPLVAVYSLGAHGSLRAIVAGACAVLGAYAAATAADYGWQLSDIAVFALGALGALAVGRAVRVMGFESEALEARASELERERDEKAEQAVAEERARIARELHDVIGHSISVMGVQAGAVRRLLTPEQEREREALLAVERVGRDAVEEMQRLLGFLRSEGDVAGTDAPLTLQRIDALAAEMRRAGLEVDVRVEGRLDDLSAGRALAGFRILQEALTNVLRHAPGARVGVTVRRHETELVIEVADDGGSGGARGGGGGHGLIGMRERAALYGGSFKAGPRPEGGFRVVAHLPLGGG